MSRNEAITVSSKPSRTVGSGNV
uniref:Uncharacterized protein n=1 Tax=Anguilla anguilla TaxID=7936 RepID=A0A0E9QF33_ANGAN